MPLDPLPRSQQVRRPRPHAERSRPRAARRRRGPVASLLAAALLAAMPPAGASAAAPIARSAGLTAREAALLRSDDRGLYVHYCPTGEQAAQIARAAAPAPIAPAPIAPAPIGGGAPLASAAMADHEGWPQDECLKMDKSGAGLSHT
ncbi:MAG TPA: hypothetical protein VKV16_04980, partial [Solirubrobacteraceae bacterium]|nr:hypothetical protein [Solirubrobacteraceae bacterium]